MKFSENRRIAWLVLVVCVVVIIREKLKERERERMASYFPESMRDRIRGKKE